MFCDVFRHYNVVLCALALAKLNAISALELLLQADSKMLARTCSYWFVSRNSHATKWQVMLALRSLRSQMSSQFPEMALLPHLGTLSSVRQTCARRSCRQLDTIRVIFVLGSLSAFGRRNDSAVAVHTADPRIFARGRGQRPGRSKSQVSMPAQCTTLCGGV